MTPLIDLISSTWSSKRGEYEIRQLDTFPYGSAVFSGTTIQQAHFFGSRAKCQAWIDRQCAEAVRLAMLTAMREPTTDMLWVGHDAARRVRLSGVSGMTIDAQTRAQSAREGAAWRAMIDAMLSETQP